jgi:hypothetical protein
MKQEWWGTMSRKKEKEEKKMKRRCSTSFESR